jgi:hypothetical protein
MSALTRAKYASLSPSGDHDLHVASTQLVEVMCECGRLNCTGRIQVPLREYDRVREYPTRFLIKEGHQVADVVRVVGYGTEYVVVAKFEADALSVGGLS